MAKRSAVDRRRAQASRLGHFSLANIGVLRSLCDRMDAELEKLVESGKLTARGADQLEKLKPGAFCLHKSWGFGRVAEWNLLLNQILIDFPGKRRTRCSYRTQRIILP